MLEGLLGSKNRERVLLFVYCRDKGYAREIARFYDTMQQACPEAEFEMIRERFIAAQRRITI